MRPFARSPQHGEHREKGSHSAAIFALDVITPSILDLGYRGAEVFGDDPRAT